jgi:hypothetical protein
MKLSELNEFQPGYEFITDLNFVAHQKKAASKIRAPDNLPKE